jgi:hypothetical protein
VRHAFLQKHVLEFLVAQVSLEADMAQDQDAGRAQVGPRTRGAAQAARCTSSHTRLHQSAPQPG